MRYFFVLFFLTASLAQAMICDNGGGEKRAPPFKKQKPNNDELKKKLISVYDDTRNISCPDIQNTSNPGKYSVNDKTVILPNPIEPTAWYIEKERKCLILHKDISYPLDDLFLNTIQQENTPHIEVKNMDILDVIFDLAMQHPGEVPQFGVVAFANSHFLGGGVKYGATAQEEHLVRASNLCRAIDMFLAQKIYFPEGERKSYVPELGAIFYPNISIFKDKNYQLLEQTYTINVIASAAYNLCSPKIPQDFADSEVYKENTRLKIRSQFLVAIKNGIKHLILGAWGCGNFGNASLFIAKEYKEAIAQYGHYFKTITFPIPRREEADELDNFSVFHRIFEDRSSI